MKALAIVVGVVVLPLLLVFGLVASAVLFTLVGVARTAQQAAPVAPQATPTPKAAPQVAKAKEAPQAAKPDPKLQAKRLDLIHKLAEYVSKWDAPSSEKLSSFWVRPAFFLLEYDDRKRIAELMHTYQHDGCTDPYWHTTKILDARSGKAVGQYGAMHGGLQIF